MTQFQLTGDENSQSLVVMYEDDDPVTIPDTHENFNAIIDLWRSKDFTEEQIRELANPMFVVGQQLAKVTDRITVAPYAVLFDGDPLRGEIADVIMDYHKEGKTAQLSAVANFLEKAATNPSISSIDGLYQWVRNGQDLVITPNGNFVAYKGVQVGKDGISESITRGEAIVDGVSHKGNIPNPDGAVVEMPRSTVDADGNVGCSVGLHAGTHSYASGFARGRLLLVEINPRDVVSVPNDCNFHKLRVSKYTVLSSIEQRLESRYYDTNANDGDFEDDEDLSDDDEDWSEEEESDCDCGYCLEDYDEDESEEDDDPDETWTPKPEETVVPPQKPETASESDEPHEEVQSEGNDDSKRSQSKLKRFFLGE